MRKEAFAIFLLGLLAARSSDAAINMMYWTNAGSVYRASTVVGSTPQLLYSGGVSYLDVDRASGTLYFRGLANGSEFIKQANLDGVVLKDVTPSALIGNKDPQYGFAVDSVNRKMYIGGFSSGVANLDGTDFTSLPLAPYTHDIEADSLHSQIYYSDAFLFHGIQRANLDGTNVQPVFDSGAYNESYSVALDPVGGKMYVGQFTTNFSWPSGPRSPVGVIYEMGLDGSNPATLPFVGLTSNITDIELDQSGGKLYWATNEAIQRGNLDGSGSVETLVNLEYPGLWYTDSLVLVDTTAVPEPSAIVVWSSLGAVGLVMLWRRRRKAA